MAVQDRKKPTCGLSIGSVGTERKMPFLQVYASILKRCRFVSVRDLYAYTELRSVNNKTFLLPDLVWNYKPFLDKKKDDSPFTVGVMLRDCGKFKDADLVAAAQKLLLHLEAEKNARFIFFNTYGERLANRTLVEPVSSVLKDVAKIPPHKTIDMIEHLDNFRSIDLLVGMPYHGFVLSCLYGVPAIGWAYESKIIELTNALRLNVIYNVNETEALIQPLAGTSEVFKALSQMMQMEAALHFNLFDRLILEREV